MRVVFVALLGASLGACATITRGTTTAFTVRSYPTGAEVKTSTGFICPATPCTFKMPRKEAFIVTVSKSGYKPIESPIKVVLAGGGAAGFVGNALAGGIIGAGVDIGSGAMDDLTPNPLEVILEPVPPAPAPVASAPAQPQQAPAPAAPSVAPVAAKP